eukprot:scaffold24890_cov44-Attheya_sp.AAC.2
MISNVHDNHVPEYRNKFNCIIINFRGIVSAGCLQFAIGLHRNETRRRVHLGYRILGLHLKNSTIVLEFQDHYGLARDAILKNQQPHSVFNAACHSSHFITGLPFLLHIQIMVPDCNN